MKKRSLNKKAFTLLEVVIVIGILAMVGSLLAVKGADLFKVYGFRQDVALLKRRLDFARYCALTYHADIEVVFSKQGEHLELSLLSDEPYLAHHPLISRPLTLRNFRSITDQQGVVIHTFLFSGTGWMFPLVDLDIHGEKGLKYNIHISSGDVVQAT